MASYSLYNNQNKHADQIKSASQGCKVNIKNTVRLVIYMSVLRCNLRY